MNRETRVRELVFARTQALFGAKANLATRRAVVQPGEVPRRNFIDDQIFGTLQARGIPSAPLSTDEEFVRRIYLDLTGKLPTPAQVRAFLADDRADKRPALIDQLLYSPEFVDKWTTWMSDWLEVAISNAAVGSIQPEGRNAYFAWVRKRVVDNVSLRDVAYQTVAGNGDTYYEDSGQANFIYMGRANAGPVQDHFDQQFYRTAKTFLGMAHYDCLLCHSGRGHLEGVSLWGRNTTRLQAQQMAAFFARTSTPRNPASAAVMQPSWEVRDNPTGTYNLNTNFGNRPNRVPYQVDGRNVTVVNPAYHFTNSAPSGGQPWRVAFAENMVKDRMFSRNIANRLWKAMFGLGLVDPVDQLDPARLDPKAKLPDGVTLQATHPELLERLAGEVEGNWYNLRETLRVIANSSAYQLSSRYDGDWNAALVTSFARHYPRRLWAEELFDAISDVTGTAALNRLFVRGWADPVQSALKLPDFSEPASPGTGNNNGTATGFMGPFNRGNRDTVPRSPDGSIQQQLALMNNTYVRDRSRLTSSPTLRAIRDLADNNAAVEQLWLTFLSRRPTSAERDRAVRALTTGNRNDAIQDLAWVLINKTEFLFSY